MPAYAAPPTSATGLSTARLVRMGVAIEWWERHQIACYLGALIVGATAGLALPMIVQPSALLITPALGILLFATFLGVPFARIGAAVRDLRFLAALLLLNFVVAPIVAFGLSRVVANDAAILIGLLLVLLTPCIDYVIVFAGIAGGAADRLLAASPILMIVQMVLLPGYLWLFGGGEPLAAVDPEPFVEALVWLIIVPLALAAGVQWLARRHGAAAQIGGAVMAGAAASMVPLMMLVLAAVVASQIAAIGHRVGSLIAIVPIFGAFAVIMALTGWWLARGFGLDIGGGRALVFSGVTRNSLVVLPLALALPASLELAPLVVVTQTLVELVVMVAGIRLIPRLVR